MRCCCRSQQHGRARCPSLLTTRSGTRRQVPFLSTRHVAGGTVEVMKNSVQETHATWTSPILIALGYAIVRGTRESDILRMGLWICRFLSVDLRYAYSLSLQMESEGLLWKIAILTLNSTSMEILRATTSSFTNRRLILRSFYIIKSFTTTMRFQTAIIGC